MSVAYRNRRKAIKRGEWDFSAQIKRELNKFFRSLTEEEKKAELAKIGREEARELQRVRRNRRRIEALRARMQLMRAAMGQ